MRTARGRRRWRALRHELRAYWGAHLHRRLFAWFGLVILLTIIAVGTTARVFGPRLALHRWHPVVFFVVPAFVVWVMTGKLARRIARPLYELVRVSREIGAGRLEARVDPRRLGFGEIEFLGRAVNDMAARIERQLADQRELLAAVSHELRTPLARARVLLDIARERGATASAFDDMEREIVEIDALVGELLASARLDFQALTTKPLDAADVARRALARAGVAPSTLAIDGELPALHADPTLVARALANLLDNARKHGGGVDRLRVSAAAGTVVFAVEDRGPGFAPGIAERAFAPFVSGGSERSGLGLGLALVERIARAHGGTVRSEAREGGGASVMLALPA